MHMFLLFSSSLLVTSQQEVSKEPFTITITIQGSNLVVGTDVWINVALKNNSGQRVSRQRGLQRPHWLNLNFLFDMLDENGKPTAKRVYPHLSWKQGKRSTARSHEGRP